MTDSNGTASEEQLARLERLRQRRASSTATDATNTPGPSRGSRRRRRHAAQGSRIVAAGLGATVMFGIVTVLGLDNPFAGAEAVPAATPPTPAVPPVAATPPVDVVVHWVPANTAPLDATGADLSGGQVAPAAPTTVPPGPITLEANPVVRTVTLREPSAPRRSTSASTPSSGSTSSSRSAPRPSPSPAPAPAATTRGSS